MFTREELFEYFAGQYSEEQIINALEELSKHNSEIDSDAEEFPTTITERLEQVFKIVEEAINQQKVLTENTTNNISPSLPQSVLQIFLLMCFGEWWKLSQGRQLPKQPYSIKSQMQSSNIPWHS
jgi:hypothetical protein